MAAEKPKLEDLKLDGRDVGERLKSIRGDKSQDEFAKELGIARKTLGRYESGERAPDMDLVLKLNFLYKVQPIWLMTGMDSTLEELTANEKAMLGIFRRQDTTTQNALLVIFNRLNELGFVAKTATEGMNKAHA